MTAMENTPTTLWSRLLPVFTLAAVVLTGALTHQMLSGTFSERTCHTDCVQMIAWGALAATVVGFLLGCHTLKRNQRPSTVVMFVVLVALLLIFATTLTIGYAVV